MSVVKKIKAKLFFWILPLPVTKILSCPTSCVCCKKRTNPKSAHYTLGIGNQYHIVQWEVEAGNATMSETKVRTNGKANLRRVDRSKLDDGGTGKSKISYVQRRRRKNLVYIAAAILGLAVAYSFLKSKNLDGTKYLRERLERAQSLKNAISSVGRLSDERHYPKRKPFTNSNRYLDPRQLATLPGIEPDEYEGGNDNKSPWGEGDDEWRVPSKNNPRKDMGPKVDYTKHLYEYPKIKDEPPTDGSYPPLQPMMDVFETWGQDDLDNPPETIVEVLQHFDYQSEWQMEVSSNVSEVVWYQVVNLLTPRFL
jgi:hypothetical protein